MTTPWSREQLDQHIREIAKSALADALPPELADPAKYVAELKAAIGAQQAETVGAAIKGALFAREARAPRVPDGVEDIQRSLVSMMAAAHKAQWRDAKHADDAYAAICKAQRRTPDSVVSKALQASIFDAGGALIPEDFSDQLIEYLRPATVVRRMGATVIEMPMGQLDIGRQNGTAQSYWLGETEAITPSQPVFGRLILSAKKLGTLVPISNELLTQTPRGMEAFVGQDMIASHAVTEDQAFIRSVGSVGRPKGIRYLTASGNVSATAGTTNAQVNTDLTKAMYKVIESDVRGTRPGWMMHPRSFLYLLTLQNNDGNYLYMEQLSRGQLMGYPVAVTTSIPRNLGGGSNETELYFGYFDQLVIGQTGQVRLEMGREAGYVQGGQQINAFPQDLTVFRLIHSVDSVLRHDRAFSVITGITWGAGLDS